MDTSEKIKIAFIANNGLSSGGTHRFLQNIAANLSKEIFDVTYFYCDSKPYIKTGYKFSGIDSNRVKYMQDHDIKLVKFDMDYIDDRARTFDWINTDFWQKFNENDFDIVQTGRAGHPEYPFNKIREKPIVDALALSGMVDNQYNISRVMHICKWSADTWIRAGGDKNRVVLISLPVEIDAIKNDLREKIGVEDKFIFGFHQRADDGIFSPIPLDAYKKIETEKTAFLIMGGSAQYFEQAKKLNIKNFKQFPPSGNSQDIYNFLQTLNVYTHGRKDGEVNSQAMAEAMYFGLPIVSHISKINNGHVECVGDAGLVVKNVEEYVEEMKKLMMDKNYYNYRGQKAKERFQEKYELKKQIKVFEDIYLDVIKNPFPNQIKRKISSLRLHYRFVYFFPRLLNYLKRKVDLIWPKKI